MKLYFVTTILLFGFLFGQHADGADADQKKLDEIKMGVVLSCDQFTINRTADGLRAKDKTGITIVNFDYTESFSILLGQFNENLAQPCEEPISISRNGKYSYLLPDSVFLRVGFLTTLPVFTKTF